LQIFIICYTYLSLISNLSRTLTFAELLCKDRAYSILFQFFLMYFWSISSNCIDKFTYLLNYFHDHEVESGRGCSRYSPTRSRAFVSRAVSREWRYHRLLAFTPPEEVGIRRRKSSEHAWGDGRVSVSRNNRAQDIAIFISVIVFSRTTLDIKFITLLN